MLKLCWTSNYISLVRVKLFVRFRWFYSGVKDQKIIGEGSGLWGQMSVGWVSFTISILVTMIESCLQVSFLQSALLIKTHELPWPMFLEAAIVYRRLAPFTDWNQAWNFTVLVQFIYIIKGAYKTSTCFRPLLAISQTIELVNNRTVRWLDLTLGSAEMIGH